MLTRTIPMAMPMGDEMEKMKMEENAWRAPKFDCAMLRPRKVDSMFLLQCHSHQYWMGSVNY